MSSLGDADLLGTSTNIDTAVDLSDNNKADLKRANPGMSHLHHRNDGPLTPLEFRYAIVKTLGEGSFGKVKL
jgi:hypothetical protein